MKYFYRASISVVLLFVAFGLSQAQDVTGKWVLIDMELTASSLSKEDAEMTIEAFRFDEWMGDVHHFREDQSYTIHDKDGNFLHEGTWSLSGNILKTPASFQETFKIEWRGSMLVLPVLIDDVSGKPGTLWLIHNPLLEESKD